MFSVETPTLKPAPRGGILEIANVITTDGYALYAPFHYVPVLQGTNKAVPTDGSDKSFDTVPDFTTSVPFAQYRGVDLPMLTMHGEGQAMLEDVFKAGEAHGVEQAVQSLILNPAAVDITPTPGTRVTNVRYAVSVLEQYIRDNYSYGGYITGNLIATNLIPELPPHPDGLRTTVSGTPIAGCGGYSATGPGGAVAAAGSAWLYVSGQINIWEGPARFAAGPSLKQNRELTLAEKAYAGTVDGPVAAILVGI